MWIFNLLVRYCAKYLTKSSAFWAMQEVSLNQRIHFSILVAGLV
ncbi:protein of unknown function [Shewanella benthica]|uniref:Uncharacterized protein n=1 Tax=Shewanella benthica TaxID=43661 RepID=A0A330M1E3_9GAMM|nr:protein of unknown function [Shewanella benthica]